MTCFISDLTSDNHLALSLSFCMSLSLSHIRGYALDEPILGGLLTVFAGTQRDLNVCFFFEGHLNKCIP